MVSHWCWQKWVDCKRFNYPQKSREPTGVNNTDSKVPQSYSTQHHSMQFSFYCNIQYSKHYHALGWLTCSIEEILSHSQNYIDIYIINFIKDYSWSSLRYMHTCDEYSYSQICVYRYIDYTHICKPNNIYSKNVSLLCY